MLQVKIWPTFHYFLEARTILLIYTDEEVQGLRES